MKKLLLIGLLAACGIAANGGRYTDPKGVEWTYYLTDNNTKAVIGSLETETAIGTGTTGDVEIPVEIIDDEERYSVVAIAKHAFYGCSSVTSFTVPAAVRSIGDESFYNCSAATNITIVESTVLTSMGAKAFYGCSKLPGIHFPSNLTSLGSAACMGCSSLREVEIPAGITSVQDETFSGCSSLASAVFRSELTKIGSSAFYNCTVLSNADDIVSAVSADIGRQAFYGVTNLFEISLADTISHVGENAFKNTGHWSVQSNNTVVIEDGCVLGVKGTCPSSVSLPAETRLIADNAFYGSAAKYVSFNSGLQIIGSYAFYNTLIKELTLPQTLTSVGTYAFAHCLSLADVSLPSSLTALPQGFFENCIGLTEVSLPDSIKSVGKWCFRNCYSLAVLDIPASLTTIGDSAFSECRDLHSVTVHRDMVLKDLIGTNICAQLTSVTLGSEVTKLSSSAFANCSKLAAFTIPDTVTNMGARVFTGCSSLLSVNYLGDAPTVDATVYEGVASGLTSYVGPTSHGWDGTTNLVAALPAKWPTTATDANKRAIAYWAGVTVTFNGNGGTPESQDKTYPSGRQYGSFPSVSNVGNTLQGWYTAASGGARVYETNTVVAGTTLYAHWTANRYTLRFESSGGIGEMPSMTCTYGVATNLPPCAFVKVGYELQGWSLTAGSRNAAYRDCAAIRNLTEKSGGTVTLYAVWRKPTGALDKQLSWSEDKWQAYESAQFDGYLVNTNSDTVVGNIAIKTSRRKVSSSGEVTISLKATVTPAGSKKTVYSGALQPDGTIAFDGTAALSLKMTAGGFSGTYDGLTVIGTRNFFTSGTVEDMTHAAQMLDRWQGTWRVALETSSADGDGAAMASGYGTLSFKIGKRGKTKVTGTLADGTKVSATAQLLVGDEFCRIPLCAPLYKKKAGGFACALQFSDEFGAELIGLSNWDASCAAKATNRFTAAWHAVAVTNAAQTTGIKCSFGVTGCPETIGLGKVYADYLPTGVAIEVNERGRWTLPTAGRVTIDRSTGTLSVTSTNCPSALRLTHARDTGVFRGSFRIYLVKKGNSVKRPYMMQTLPATVSGAMLGDTGYGTAVVRDKFSMPVTVKRTDK